MTDPILRNVLEACARYYSVPVKDMLAIKRTKSLVIARQTAMYVARMIGDYSYPEIGEAFRREHTTVMHSVQTVTKKSVKDRRLKAALDELVVACQSAPVTGIPIKIRAALMERIDLLVATGLHGRSAEELVDRILCDYFQREHVQKSP
jgi:hypothetical protein